METLHLELSKAINLERQRADVLYRVTLSYQMDLFVSLIKPRNVQMDLPYEHPDLLLHDRPVSL